MLSARTSALSIVSLSVMLCAMPSLAAVWNVSTVSALTNAVNGANTGDEIVIAGGTYNMTSTLVMNTQGVTLRGATGNRDDVVLVGGGMNNDVHPRNGILIRREDITVRDLTVSECYWNGIQLQGETNRVHRTLLSNVKTLNIGERHIKGSKGSLSNEMNDIIIENSYLVQDKPRLVRPNHSVDPYDYIGGIDAMIAKNWIIRDNVFEGIKGAAGDSRGAIFLWQNVENPLIERNVFLDCARSISMGNPSNSTGTWLVDGGIIRNNMILKGNSVALEFDYTKDLQVYNNTVWGAPNYHRTVQIADTSSIPTTNLDLRNNIIVGRVADQSVGTWSNALFEAAGNIMDDTGSEVLEQWFVDAAGGDLHLTDLATGAIGLAPWLAMAPEDFDGEMRTNPTDFGADQYIPEPATMSLLFLGAIGLLRRKP